jgi:hypothetical protein
MPTRDTRNVDTQVRALHGAWEPTRVNLYVTKVTQIWL